MVDEVYMLLLDIIHYIIKHYDSWDTQLPNSERINDRTISIPLHQNLSDNDTIYSKN